MKYDVIGDQEHLRLMLRCDLLSSNTALCSPSILDYFSRCHVLFTFLEITYLSPGLVSFWTSLLCRWGQLIKALVSGTVSLLCFELWLLLWTLNGAHWYLFLDNNCECFLGPTIQPLFSQIKQAKCTHHPHFRIRHQMDNIGQCEWVEGRQQDVPVIKSMWHI